MTQFEELAMELIGKVETGARGFYVGRTEALAQMTTEVIMSDDDAIFELGWEDQKEIIKEKFFRVFPYMKK